MSTSLGLIRRALEQGAIDDQTALMYQVFAVFEDPRLPDQYRGDDSTIVDSLVMADVRSRFETLRTDVRAALAPFLVPPVYEGSGVQVLQDPPPCSLLDKLYWTYLDTTNGAVRIWWRKARPDDGTHATEMRKWIDEDIWPKLVTLYGGRVPESDLSQVCNGGDGKLDIYLTDRGKAVATPFRGCGPTPVYITSGVANGRIGRQTLAHELSHAFQFAYTLKSCLQSTGHRWWGEATSQWVMHYVYPGRNYNNEHHAAPHLLNSPEQSLDLFNDAHEYGAYLYPLFLAHKLGIGVITASWESSQTMDAVNALETATKGAGGFEKLWPEFVLQNWNRDPIEGYNWDDLTHAAKPAFDGPAFDSIDAYRVLTTQLPRLSAKYFRFTMPNTARAAAFLNGMKYRLTRAQQTWNNIDFGLQYKIEDHGTDTAPGGSIRVLIKQRGRWLLPAENWTTARSHRFCLQNSEDSIDEIVFIFANSDIDPNREVKPPSLEPLFVTTNFGCRWSGNYTFTAAYPMTLAVGDLKIVYNFERTAVKDPATEGAFFPGFQYENKLWADWSTSGSGAGCSYSGAGRLTPLNYIQLTFNFAPSTSTSYRRAYFPTQVPVKAMKYIATCPGGSLERPVPIGQFFPVGSDPFLKIPVQVNGSVIKGELEQPNIGKWTWEFKAEQ